jgi:hypothetical protein
MKDKENVEGNLIVEERDNAEEKQRPSCIYTENGTVIFTTIDVSRRAVAAMAAMDPVQRMQLKLCLENWVDMLGPFIGNYLDKEEYLWALPSIRSESGLLLSGGFGQLSARFDADPATKTSLHRALGEVVGLVSDLWNGVHPNVASADLDPEESAKDAEAYYEHPRRMSKLRVDLSCS